MYRQTDDVRLQRIDIVLCCFEDLLVHILKVSLWRDGQRYVIYPDNAACIPPLKRIKRLTRKRQHYQFNVFVFFLLFSVIEGTCSIAL